MGKGKGKDGESLSARLNLEGDKVPKRIRQDYNLPKSARILGRFVIDPALEYEGVDDGEETLLIAWDPDDTGHTDAQFEKQKKAAPKRKHKTPTSFG